MKSSKSIEEWLHFASVSASTLFLTTGGHYPAPLCLCYGKKRHAAPLERNLYTITRGGEELKLKVSRLLEPPPGVRGDLSGGKRLGDNTKIHSLGMLLLSQIEIFVAGRLQ